MLLYATFVNDFDLAFIGNKKDHNTKQNIKKGKCFLSYQFQVR